MNTQVADPQNVTAVFSYLREAHKSKQPILRKQLDVVEWGQLQQEQVEWQARMLVGLLSCEGNDRTLVLEEAKQLASLVQGM